MAATHNPGAGGRPFFQIPEEQTPQTENYPRRLGKQPMKDHSPDEGSASSDSRGLPAPRPDEDIYYNPERYIPIMELENRQLHQQLAEATRRNEELARQAAEVQAPPQRPRGRPRESTTARRAEQGAQQTQPRPKANMGNDRPGRNTQANIVGNPTAEVTIGIGNNRAPPAARSTNPESIKNNLKPIRANSGPSKPNNGRPPPSPIRHPLPLIRHPSPLREAPKPTPNRNRAGEHAPQRPSRSGSRDGNCRTQPGHGGEREATQGHRVSQPAGNHMLRSQMTGAIEPVEDPPHNNQAPQPERNDSFMSGSLDLTMFVSVYNTKPKNIGNYENNPDLRDHLN
ncbi:pollen-specific leucine-rich repeat extensin-like protein 1 [Humulus lupulus]|uniref:pollen-specific leucine-rich repeat extensin-like protein 1 n=1 Tax=Humulus lupulus TaxID=3486 RepID=UPI002B40492B|nr:pollen-specific leucine-rich repeat extensin-like protein 1 [Humulus lupulus]